MTYDALKATNPADEFLGPEPPPCERHFGPGRKHLHPRYPSGWCADCGAHPQDKCGWYDEDIER